MRALAITVMAWILTSLAQVASFGNFEAILDKYGFPTLIAAVMFVYFSRQLKKSNDDKDDYRSQTIDLLKSLLKEAQKATAVCRFEAVQCEVKRNGLS